MAAAMTVGFMTESFIGAMRLWSNVPSFITALALFTGLRGTANLVTNGMTLLDVSEYWQYVVRGAIILGAVLLNQVIDAVSR